MISYALIIPARYQSSRFPGKPLANILGKSLIQRVWENCRKAIAPELIYIATDNQRIQEHCEAFKANVLITPSDCLTGTDRIVLASQQLNVDLVINVQGDEPAVNPEHITFILEQGLRQPELIHNAMAPITTRDDFFSANVPKVVTDQNNKLLYISRAAIPTTKSLEFRGSHRQVCIYSFHKDHLSVFGNCKDKTPLEKLEDIEILRFLELGLPIQMHSIETTAMAVDTPEDILRVERWLVQHQQG